ncbi:MAG: hypothetical protein JSS90_08375 [Bacteroidetes bacterium]|nr:hypothetical protein [Bacteroidota bacterium]
MIKRCLLPVFFCIELFFSPNAIAQNRNSIWCFGDSARIDFVNGVPVAGSSNVVARGSSTSIADSSGNLLFYTYINFASSPPFFATTIANKLGLVMDGSDSITGIGQYNENLVIPNPSGQSKFYLFNVSHISGAPPPMVYFTAK